MIFNINFDTLSTLQVRTIKNDNTCLIMNHTVIFRVIIWSQLVSTKLYKTSNFQNVYYIQETKQSKL